MGNRKCCVYVFCSSRWRRGEKRIRECAPCFGFSPIESADVLGGGGTSCIYIYTFFEISSSRVGLGEQVVRPCVCVVCCCRKKKREKDGELSGWGIRQGRSAMASSRVFQTAALFFFLSFFSFLIPLLSLLLLFFLSSAASLLHFSSSDSPLCWETFPSLFFFFLFFSSSFLLLRHLHLYQQVAAGGTRPQESFLPLAWPIDSFFFFRFLFSFFFFFFFFKRALKYLIRVDKCPLNHLTSWRERVLFSYGKTRVCCAQQLVSRFLVHRVVEKKRKKK